MAKRRKTQTRKRKKKKGERNLAQIASARTKVVEGQVIYTTTKGIELVCFGIADDILATRAQIHGEIDWPERPTRTVTDAAGSTADFELTQKYVESDEATDDEKEAWAHFRLDLLEAEAEYNKRDSAVMSKLLVLRGFDLVDKSLMTTYADEQKYLGLSVPDDPRERRLRFFLSSLFGNLNTDMTGIMLGIFRASGYDEEVLAKVEASFPSHLGRRKRDPAQRDQEGTEQNGPTGAVEGEPEARSDESEASE